MNKLKPILPLVVIMLLAGCSKKQPEVKTVVVTKVRYVYKITPKDLLKREVVPKPVGVKKYMSMGIVERGKEDTKLILKLFSALGRANVKLKAIEDWDDAQRKNYEDVE